MVKENMAPTMKLIGLSNIYRDPRSKLNPYRMVKVIIQHAISIVHGEYVIYLMKVCLIVFCPIVYLFLFAHGRWTNCFFCDT